MGIFQKAGRALRLLGLASLAAAVAGAASAAEPLRVGMIPDAGATQVSVEQKAPLQKYLEQQLGRPVKLVIPTNYNATVEGLGNGSLDVAYLGGLTFVKARARYGVVPLVQRDIDRQFHSLFITRASSGITGLAQLKSKTFCFGDINSTSGHLYPYLAMKRAGVSADKGLKSFRYTGSHPATIQGVAAGVCDAGAVDETVWKSMAADGKLPADLKVFNTFGPFADYVWVARKDLAAKDRQAVAAAFLRLQAPRDAEVLDILRGQRFIRADDKAYGDVERTAKELGLM
ncbi:MAG TPA: phosphate/phosphite/phosphonate ABC transporter substrate-binding protein [Phenylobacterium sp.]|uniref:phosphate/phosphite/phosphonate ABC transporter substrate-binding protein n=1 Tax=Phenylobacterium sp. TaxID=1871053 RepID=UPI002B473011|nr:phosphate/phosphite/phosphonate ABC transporter substrate-binding protein [Phenylobacterium sp.]HKR89647.1 phosphate/phosphite/phosphonate ABC transporter substrate-binding protein [Phenylobacterium sp.]